MCAKFVTRFQFPSGPSDKATLTRWDPSPLQKWAYRGVQFRFGNYYTNLRQLILLLAPYLALPS